MYHYIECGLDNVWLINGYTVREIEGYGEVVSFDDLCGLHKTIGISLTKKNYLSGDEFRFLRKECELSQAKLAHSLGVKEQTVSLWERGMGIPKYAVKAIKGLYLEHVDENPTFESIYNAPEIEVDVETKDGQLQFEERDGSWMMPMAA